MVQHRKVVAEFEDKYGDTRQLVRAKGRLGLARSQSTVALSLNRAAAKLIGARIKQARKEAGLTLSQLCIRAGLVSATPKQRMYEIENATRDNGLRPGTLYAIAHALSLPAYALMPSNEEVMALAQVADIVPEPTLSVTGQTQFRVVE